MNVYDIGDVPEVFIHYTLPASTTLFNPATVACIIQNPAGVKKTYTFGTDSELVRPSTGYYTLQFTVDKSGFWTYRWVSTGSPGQGEEERKFRVRATPIYPGI